MTKFAAFDIDGTLIRWQLYHAVSSALLRQNNDQSLYETIRAARKKWKQREHAQSFKDYERALVDAYDMIVRDLTIDEFETVAEQVFQEHKDQVYTYTRDLVTQLKKEGYFLLAISGSQREIVEKIAKYYGFDDCVGTKFVRKNGTFTGEKIVASHDKKTVLTKLIEQHGLERKDSIAVGDSESDIPMLELVERPIAFNPTEVLFAHAKNAGWEVVVERKNMIYSLQPSKKGNDGSYILA